MRTYLPLAIVPLALILWGLFGAPALLNTGFRVLSDYQTPYTEQPQPGADGEALTSQVVLVVAGGLRLDQSTQMSNLNALRARGADRLMRAGLPSFSLPAWSVIGTGAWPEHTGQSTDISARPLALDSIFLAARRKGSSTALTGPPGWSVLFKDHVEMLISEPDPPAAPDHLDQARKQDDAVEADALRVLRENNPNLLLIYFGEAEFANHAYGAGSHEDRQARQDVDARLGRLLQVIDLSKSTLLFTSDHGHIDRGGHGGPEDAVLNVPFVAAGRAILSGHYEAATQADIAPTIAVVLGASLPTANQGDVLFDMLDSMPSWQAQRTVDWAKQVVSRADFLAKVIAVGSVEHPKLATAQTALAAGDTATAIGGARAEVQATRDVLFAFREGRLETERLTRTPAFLLILLPLALYVWFMRREGWPFRRPLLGAFTYFVVFYAVFFARGDYFSFSVLNADERLVDGISARTADALLALITSTAVIAILSRASTPFQLLLDIVNTAFVIGALLWLQLDVFYWLWDFTWLWYLPDQTLTVKFYLDVVQSGAFMLSNPPMPVILILPLLALAAQWLAQRVLPVRAQSASD